MDDNTPSTDHVMHSTREADRANGEPDATEERSGLAAPAGRDTATGTDPDAKYDQPGYEDKSFGQAVGQDQDLVDRLAEESADDSEAEERFQDESAGAPALRRQHEHQGHEHQGEDVDPGGAP